MVSVGNTTSFQSSKSSFAFLYVLFDGILIFLGLLEKSLNVSDLLAKYKGTAIIVICMNLAIAFGIQITSMKKYTILVDNAVHINEMVK
jgi:hypothetical protein